MTKITFSQEGLTPFQQLLGHNKDILEKWSSLEECIFNSNTFTSEFKEQLRRVLAFNNGCQYCMAKGKPSNQITYSKILIASKIADIVSKNHIIDDKHFNLLKNEFSDKEISELLALICFITASQKFGALLDLQPSCPI
ncbi:carboxymuconolactone decarboxylase family protein [Clostridium sp. OS1-26]|uniref:carboxymuconolactone decarboxylase family protein n=1 Tax=Clostridium sp. OS1-26 TaxID=3070681 RepID=UPI0027E1CD6C|nr:carboxymuconolactone decarboxylase family protein [Clostridium sp. OS1-26]WML33657.1 carboxymuconolactone decarboxylase family protein [Clostridium sp. OS1-26]